MEKRISQIQKQEQSLNRANDLIEKLESLIEDWQKLRPQFSELMEYYGSEQWHDDVEDSNEGAFKDFPHGVLSEDAVYDMFHRQRELNFKMMRVALDYLE